MLDYEEIRKEIAIAHNVLLDKDDSALVMATLNELMFRHYSEHLAQQAAEQNEAHRKAIDVALQKSVADAKLTAGRVITEAAAFVSDQVNTAVTSALEDGLTQVRRELLEAKKEVKTARNTASTVIVFCAAMIVFILLRIVS